MIDTINIILILLNIVFFTLGYLVGKINSSQSSIESQPISFLRDNQQQQKINKISIDETKYVTDIKTDGMEKLYDNLGEVKTSNEQIDQSINKLKNLKK